MINNVSFSESSLFLSNLVMNNDNNVVENLNMNNDIFINEVVNEGSIGQEVMNSPLNRTNSETNFDLNLGQYQAQSDCEPIGALGSLYMCQWNANGFFCHYEEFKRLVSYYDPIITCIQETRFRHGSSPSLRGYEVFHTGEDLERANGGVAILVKNGISAKELQLHTQLQAVAVRVVMQVSMTVCSLYVPPSANLVRAEFEQLLSQLPEPFIVCTDINARNGLWGSERTDMRGRMIEEVLEERNLNILNDGSPTHVSFAYGTESAIDLTFCTPALQGNLEWFSSGDNFGSDHYPLLLRMTGPCMRIEGRPNWRIKEADWPMFDYLLLQRGHLLDETEYDGFINHILDAASASIPRTTGKHRSLKVPWWNEEIAECVKMRRKFKRKVKRCNSQYNMNMFRMYNAKVRCLTRRSRKKCWQEYVSTINVRTPVTEVWQKLRRLRGGSDRPPIISLNDNDVIVSDQVEVAEMLARHYVQVSSSDNYDEDFRRFKQAIENSEALDFSDDSCSFNVPFTMEELKESLRCSKDSTSGPDQVHYQMLRHLPDEWLSKLLDIYNEIWSSGRLPDSWKISLILPILKPNKDPCLAANYRPIALTSCVGKIFERMVNFRLTWFIDEKIDMSQCGFRRFCGAEDCQVFLEENMLNARLNHEHCFIVSLDIKSAFDVTWRHGILRKLNELGVNGRLLKFCKEFMTDRRIKVAVGSTQSIEHSVENGIIQGSVISPTLFRVALYDLPSSVSDPACMIGYADDWNLIVRHFDKREGQDITQVNLDAIVSWMDLNGFRLSIDKCVALYLPPSRYGITDQGINLQMKGNPIKLTDQHKILGVFFDSRVSWKPHIQYIKDRAKPRLNLLRTLANIKFGSDQDLLLRLHQVLILSVINYGCPAYSSATRSALKSLNSIHNAGMRISLGAFKTTSIEYMENESGMEDLEGQRDKRTLCLAAKILALPRHPLYPYLVYEIEDEELDQYKCRQNSFTMRVRFLLRQYDLSFEDVEDLNFIGTEPWLRTCIMCDLRLTCSKKDDTYAGEFKIKFRELLNEYRGYLCVYTDGSVQDDLVGYGLFGEGLSVKQRITSGKCIMSAELSAIKHALIICNEREESNFLICTDSLSSLYALQSMNHTSMLVNEIRELYHAISVNRRVIFVWIPSHVGIPGNELADELAREALNLNELLPVCRTVEEVKSQVRCATRQAMLIKWEQKGGQMWNLKQTFTRWRADPGLPRAHQVVISRLRMGHTRLTHSCFFEGLRISECNCGEQLTVRHILLDCSQYAEIRERTGIKWDSIGRDREANRKIIEFLQTCDILNEV